MNHEELDLLAHQIAYETARGDIEGISAWYESPNTLGYGHWYDLSSKAPTDVEAQHRARAIFYLDARGFLIRNREKPFYVRILDAPAGGFGAPLVLEPRASATA